MQRPVHQAALLCTICLYTVLTGCASAPNFPEGLGNMGTKALETIGYKKPELPAAPAMPQTPAMPTIGNIPQLASLPSTGPPNNAERSLKLRITASDSLNVDANGNALALVVRIYKLRDTTAFLNAPYEVFGNPTREKEILADAFIDVREVVLLPSGQYQLHDRWAGAASHIGVVALYRIAHSANWRYAFELNAAQPDDGLVIAAHACALSLGAGQPIRLAQASLAQSTPDCPTRKINPIRPIAF
jgi:type VI secretion system protein VasD